MRERVEKRRRVIAAIVAICAEAIRTRVEDLTYGQFCKKCLVREWWGPWGCSVSKLAAWRSTLVGSTEVPYVPYSLTGVVIPLAHGS